MKTRKWKCSGVPIKSFSEMFDSMKQYGGVWVYSFGKFANSAWIVSQRLNTLINYINRRVFYYPALNEKEETI